MNYVPLYFTTRNKINITPLVGKYLCVFWGMRGKGFNDGIDCIRGASKCQYAHKNREC